jgi:hypothetical protein
VSERLDELRVGEQISHMILGALCDTKWINSDRGDVKADRHLNRVVGRIFRGERFSSEETVRVTRLMKDENPWLLDKPLFDIGQKYLPPVRPELRPMPLMRRMLFRGGDTTGR